MIFKQYTLNGKRRVSNGKCHVIKRKQTCEKVCGLCLNANSCILFVGNSLSLAPPPPSANVYVLQYSSFWNRKAKSYGIKTASYATSGPNAR